MKAGFLKRWIYVLVLVCMLAPLSAVPCRAGTTFHTSGEFVYITLENGPAIIVRCRTDEEEVDIPEELDGHIVLGLEADSFAGCGNLRKVTIPDTLEIVPSNPFSTCQTLEEVVVSERNTGLAVVDGALYFKSKKELIFCPANKESFSIPDGVEKIGAFSIAACLQLKEVTIPDTVEYIDDYAFPSCMQLEEVNIPENVRTLGKNPFLGCYSLKEIALSEKNTRFLLDDGVLYSRIDKRLVFCPLQAEACDIQKDTRIIGANSFFGCMNLAEAEIPGSVKVIEESAFEECRNLQTVQASDGLERIGAAAFRNCFELRKVVLPSSVNSIGEDAFTGCSQLVVEAPENSYAASYCMRHDIEFLAAGGKS